MLNIFWFERKQMSNQDEIITQKINYYSHPIKILHKRELAFYLLLFTNEVRSGKLEAFDEFYKWLIRSSPDTFIC